MFFAVAAAANDLSSGSCVRPGWAGLGCEAGWTGCQTECPAAGRGTGRGDARPGARLPSAGQRRRFGPHAARGCGPEPEPLPGVGATLRAQRERPKDGVERSRPAGPRRPGAAAAPQSLSEVSRPRGEGPGRRAGGAWNSGAVWSEPARKAVEGRVTRPGAEGEQNV